MDTLCTPFRSERRQCPDRVLRQSWDGKGTSPCKHQLLGNTTLLAGSVQTGSIGIRPVMVELTPLRTNQTTKQLQKVMPPKKG